MEAEPYSLHAHGSCIYLNTLGFKAPSILAFSYIRAKPNSLFSAQVRLVTDPGILQSFFREVLDEIK